MSSAEDCLQSEQDESECVMSRILVTGSRTWSDETRIREALEYWAARLPGATLVHGQARGADLIAARIWAGWGYPAEVHPARWGQHGKAADLLRNREMVAVGADVCLAFIHNHSRGATHCAAIAQASGIPTYRIRAAS